MSRIKTIIILLAGVYCIAPNEYLKIALLAGVVSYLMYILLILIQLIYGIFRKIYTDGMLETLQDMESFTKDLEDMNSQIKETKNKLKEKIFEVFKIKFLF